MIDWTCPNCHTQHQLPTESQSQVRRIEVMLADKKDCKFCVRKDPNIPTTAEMDGLLTPEEMRERFYVMKKCQACNKFTRQDTRKDDTPCSHCGVVLYDPKSTKSIRTYDEFRDNKKKTRSKR